MVTAEGVVHHWDGSLDRVASHKIGCALVIDASIITFGLHHLTLRLGIKENRPN